MTWRALHCCLYTLSHEYNDIVRDVFPGFFFLFWKKTTYCCRTRRLSSRPSVCLSVRLSSVQIIYFRGNLILTCNRPIVLKFGLNVVYEIATI